jgi:pimeloyl-ACP methyl ester carboxylesterase
VLSQPVIAQVLFHLDVRLHALTEGIPTQKHRTPLVFVHGAWHASWCWEENFIPFFVNEGFVCHVFDFRGHGQSEGREALHSFHLRDYAEDLGQVVGTAKEKPVLVAHSMGGLVAQLCAQDHDVAGLVLLAPVPVSGVGYGYARAHPLPFLKFLLTRKGKAMISGEKLSKSLFFSQNISDDLLRKYYGELQDESFRALFENGRGIGWKPLRSNPPLLIAEARRDAVISRKRLAKTAKLYGTDLARLDDLAHDVMLDVEWRKCAELVKTWLTNNGF